MMMPAWRSGDYVCVKLVNMFPGNADRGMPAVNGIVILFDGRTGEVLAQVDGGEVTAHSVPPLLLRSQRIIWREKTARRIWSSARDGSLEPYLRALCGPFA